MIGEAEDGVGVGRSLPVRVRLFIQAQPLPAQSAKIITDRIAGEFGMQLG